MVNMRYKVLLIEDDKLDQIAFKRLVKDEDLLYDYTIARSVSEANSILSTDKFDIAIVDYLLGDGTAFDIFDSLKDTPIIIATASGDEEIAVKAMKAGVCDYLIKDPERNYLKTLPITLENVVKHKKTEEKLKEYDQLKNQLAITVSHELRTSLCIFKGIISNAIAGMLGPISDELQEKLQTVDKTIDRLTKAVSDFLDISKIETGKKHLLKTKVDMQQVVSEAIALLTDLAAEKKIELSAYLLNPNFAVYADHSMIRQIFVNLIDNAIKFSPMGSTICITAKDLEDEVQVNMQNTSIGADSEDASELFNSFVQDEEYSGPDSYTINFGLYVAKQLIKVQAGRIWAESVASQGSIFCFTLPKYSEQIHRGTLEPVKTS